MQFSTSTSDQSGLQTSKKCFSFLFCYLFRDGRWMIHKARPVAISWRKTKGKTKMSTLGNFNRILNHIANRVCTRISRGLFFLLLSFLVKIIPIKANIVHRPRFFCYEESKESPISWLFNVTSVSPLVDIVKLFIRYTGSTWWSVLLSSAGHGCYVTLIPPSLGLFSAERI